MGMAGEIENLQMAIALKEEELFALAKEIADLENKLEELQKCGP
tara:strand:+ start:156 stop:287 length:132 start_codon:yes stop_codon:yes gene_type:complete